MRNCPMDLDFSILVNCRNEEFNVKQDYAGLVDCLTVAHYKCNRDLYAVPGIYGHKSPVFISINPLHL